MRHERFWPLLIGVLSVLSGLLLVDFLLVVIGSTYPEVRQDPAVWGTYSAWASAILPSLALLATAKMWVRDRRAGRIEAMRKELMSVKLDEDEGHPRYLRNGSNLRLSVELQQGDAGSTVHPKRDLLIASLGSSADEEAVIFSTYDGQRWSISAGSAPIPLEPGRFGSDRR